MPMILFTRFVPKSLLIILLSQGLSQLGVAQVTLQNLSAENQSNPVGLSTAKPRFSWQLLSSQRNVKQTAYEIQVTQAKNEVWRSGKIASDASVFIEYAGTPLQSGKAYTWQVRVWDNQGHASAWSKGSFLTALLNQSDWKASWISSGLKADSVNGLVPMFRKTFSTTKKVQSAIMSLTSLGIYEAQINGKRISNAYLTPGWTSYNKHLQFQTYDVTNLVVPGKNAIGVLLGSGWYRTRLSWLNKQNIYGKETALLAQLTISYTDGSQETVVSDGSWKAAPSHITYAEIYNGENQDTRLQIPDWSLATFNDTRWTSAVVRDHPKANLTPSINEPIRPHETFKPVKVLTTPKGETVLDFGQNLVGWVRVQATGKPGSTLTLSHVEMLDKQGNLYFDNLRTAKAQAHYTLRGNGTETLEPHFTFFGFRYVRVEGLSGPANPADFTAVALYSDMKPTGTFTSSNALLNQLQRNIQWGQRGNFLDVPTDCPQRDERLGWTGDAEVFARTAAYNFNVNQFFAKWLIDVAADQAPNGAIPFVVPDVLGGMGGQEPAGAAGWSDAGIIIPWTMYLTYGDRRTLENQYPSMKAYLNYMRKAAKNDLWNTGFQFADWLSYRVDDSKGMIGMKSAITDNYLVAQCFYAYSAELMAKTARILGKTEEANDYDALLTRIRAAFQEEFMTASGRLISETQTAYILALQFDMMPEVLRPQAVKRLEDNIKSYDYHLTTGFLGTPFLNHVLTRFGKNDVAYKLLLQDTYPSWLFPVKMGATTIWERWDSQKPDSTFQDPGMTSFNHYAYGAIGDWMYQAIAGIDTREEGAGYRESVIRPRPGGNLTAAKGTLITNYGLLSSGWTLDNGQLRMEVEIPANTSATVYFPASNPAAILENGQPIPSSAGIRADSNGKAMMARFGSGKYVFTVSNPSL